MSKSENIFVIGLTFFLHASVQEFFVPYCCVFCVLLNDMLNVSLGTFQKLHPHQLNSDISLMLGEQNRRFGVGGGGVPKAFSYEICMNQIHEVQG